MVDHATAKYLSDNIGGVLAKAMAEMAVAQPSDGVDFLAGWLKACVEQEEEKVRKSEEEVKLQEARAKSRADQEEKAARRRAKEEAAAAREAVYQDLLKKFNDPSTVFQDTDWQELVTAASVLLGAKAVYLGIVDDEGLEDQPGPLIRYEETTAEAKAMKEKVLLQGQGVTWGAVSENIEGVPFIWKPPQPPLPEADPADPDAPPPEIPALPYYPVSVGCVTDVTEEPKPHFFEMTRLGAYVAVPLVYSSYYSAEALAGAKQYEEEKKATELRLAELQENYEKAVEEARAAGGDEAVAAIERPAELDAPQDKPLVLPGQTVKMVLCADTLGTNGSIPEAKIHLALDLATACARCKENTEKLQVDEQAKQLIDEEARKQLEEEIAAARTRVEEENQEAQHAEEAEVAAEEEYKKDAVHKRWAYEKARQVFFELKDAFLRVTSLVVVPPEFPNVLAATALLFGYTKQELHPKRKATLRWPLLVKVIQEDAFWERLGQADVGTERRTLPEQKLANLRALVPESLDGDKAKAVHPLLEVLLAVFSAGVAHRLAEIAARKAAAAAAEEKTEEAEEEEW